MPSQNTASVSPSRSSWFLTSALLVGITAVGVHGFAQQQDTNGPVEASTESVQSLEGWKSSVWEAAKSGDSEILSQRLQAIPESADPELAADLRESVEAWNSHLIEAEGDRSDDRAEAFTEMNDLLAESKLVEALNFCQFVVGDVQLAKLRQTAESLNFLRRPSKSGNKAARAGKNTCFIRLTCQTSFVLAAGRHNTDI